MIQKSTHAIPRMDLGAAFHEYSTDRMRFISDDILPVKGVRKKSATLSVCKRENITVPDTRHANGATFNRVDLYMDDMDYLCVDHGLEGQVTDEDQENYVNDFDAEVEKTQAIKIKMKLARELRVNTLIFDPVVWTGEALYTDVSAAPWDAIASGIIAQIQAAREVVRLNCGLPPNSLIISESSMINLMNNTQILGKFPGVTVLTEAMLRSAMASILGIQNLIVGQAVYNSADEGLDFVGAEIWSDDYAMLAVLGSEGLPMTEPQLGRTMMWEAYVSDLEYVESYREEQTKSEIVRVEQYVQEKVFDPYFGHLLKIDE